MQLDGKNRGAPPNKLQAMAVLSALAKNAQLLKVPDGVVGFKVHDAAAVRQQLERLEKLVSAALEANPQLKMQLKKTEIGGVQYLTLTLDGSMIPWEEVQIDEFRQFEANKGDVDKIVARLKEMTLTRGHRPAGRFPAGLAGLVHRRPGAFRPGKAPLRAAGIGPAGEVRRQAAGPRRLPEQGDGAAGLGQ